jgi:maltose alpha-D-glucosyltransferase/alpha-amylase
MKRENGPSDPLWYKDAVFYELRVRSFYDSNGDGVGDFPGLTQKLDYLQSLGVTTLWLLPFYPSPMRDDGYDISSYTDVYPECGTLQEFKNFLREAHRLGLHVVTELVLNHTSDQHEWFQRARRAPAGSKERDYYVWRDNSDGYKEARVIFQDFEPSNWSWDPLAKSYYFHRFFAHQPDLNFDNPAVRKEMLRIVDFWLGLGVDGMRLDAVPYLFEREGTNCENLPETHAYLRELREHVDKNFSNRMLLAEANQWPEDAVAYLAEGKECHMAFHFPIMPRMFMSVRMEDRFPLTDIWAQTPPIDNTCQWALFVRNHDELTLEMVTDEERDYMYRAYAQESRMRINLGIRRRLCPLLGNNRRAVELINGLLFSLPGTPVLYYGDEIGMGDNVYLGDRDGVRTPMQWSGDRNAGFSSANPQRLILPVVIDYEYHYQTINVEAQEANRHSLLWWMRRLIALRRQYKAFGRGAMEFLSPDNPRVIAYVRSFENERILVVANLSRFVQYVELDLSRFKGMCPIELFSHSPFPPIGDLPYLLTLGPHGFVWFSIETPRAGVVADLSDYKTPRIQMSSATDGLMRAQTRQALRRILPEYLPRCRWFRSKTRTIKSADIADLVALSEGEGAHQLAFVTLEYTNTEPETYVLPLGVASGEQAHNLRINWPEHVIADVTFPASGNGAKASSNGAANDGAGDGVLYDASVDPGFGREMLALIDRHRRGKGQSNEFVAHSTDAFRELYGAGELPEPKMLKAEQSNTSIMFGDRFILKIFRKLESGLNPDIEVGRFLTQTAHFPHTPPLAGWIDYRPGRAEGRNLAILQGFVPNQGDAWQFTLAVLERYFENAATRADQPVVPDKHIVDLAEQAQPDPLANELIGAYLHAANLIGQRVAELHVALLSDLNDPEFAPEGYSSLYQRSVYQSMRNLLGRVMRQLAGRMRMLPKELQPGAQAILDHKDQVGACFDSFLKHRLSVARQRTHGDLHLGQMLYTGKDFVIIDFEGEPARQLTERRRKRSALRDVGGMLRSFGYAALSQMTHQLEGGALGKADFATMEPWARFWQTWCSWAFLRGYLETAKDTAVLPKSNEELRILIDAFVLEKAVYELGYELDNRPTWAFIPIHGIAQIAGIAAPTQVAAKVSAAPTPPKPDAGARNLERES